MFWIYDLPNWLLCALVVATVCLFGVGGLFLTRRLLARWFRESEGVNEMVGYILSTIGMFYGITLGLIAVGAWQTFGDVQGIVSQESAALATLYRYVSQYPEPARSELQSGMQEYTLFVIQKGWPAQRKGLTPREGTKSLVNRVINPLGAFEPHNLREQVLHQEAMRQLSNMIDLRRKRFESVSSGMPISLWTLVLVGAALNLSLCWLFRCRKV